MVDGLEADVVTMNQANDIDILAERGSWCRRTGPSGCPHNSAPTTSIIGVPGAQGQPEGASRTGTTWAKPGVGVIIPNPKTSGNGRYTYLAAWGAGMKAGLSRRRRRKALVTRIFANVPVLDGGGRGATTTFAQRNVGDALVTFESEVPLISKEFGDNFEVVYPSRTILAENPVSVVDKVVDKKGTRKLAEAYLQFLYSRRRPGDRRQAPPAPAQRRRCWPSTRSSFPKRQHLHRRRGLRRLDQGAEGALRRRRHLRPDHRRGEAR